MSKTSELIDVLKKVQAHYEIADGFVREVGLFCDEVSIPAMNELRYAGYHVFQAIDATTGAVADLDHLRKALGHCDRAQYEAAEAGIMEASGIITRVRSDHPDIVISDVLKAYPDFLKRAKKAYDAVIEGRSGRSSVTDHTEQYIGHFRALKEAVDDIDAYSDDLRAASKKVENDNRKYYLQMAVRIGVPIAVIVLTFLLRQIFEFNITP